MGLERQNLRLDEIASTDCDRVEVDLAAIASQFASPGTVAAVRPLGSGLINDTFLVTRSDRRQQPFVLQRLNRHVFRQPQWVMHNLRVFTTHARQQLATGAVVAGRRWQVPQVIPARGDLDAYIDADGEFWRALSYIDGTQSLAKLETPAQAREVGCGLGIFHALASGLDCDRLKDTLVGFHITPAYLQQFDEASGLNPPIPSEEVDYCWQFIGDRRGWASVLEDAKAGGQLQLRTIHGDPKVNNLLFDAETRQAVSAIDLDTVKPGLVHYDIGDCLRSSCNRSGSSTTQVERVAFDLDFCRQVLTGYFAQAGEFWTEGDRAYLFDAIRLLPFELGLRYFTDYLAGNPYFKVNAPRQNLVRALVQFKLVESIERQEREIRALLAMV